MKYKIGECEYDIHCPTCKKPLGGRDELAAYPLGDVFWCLKHKEKEAAVQGSVYFTYGLHAHKVRRFPP